MSSAYKGNGWLPIIVTFVIVFALMFLVVYNSVAHAAEGNSTKKPHPSPDFYMGKTDPVTGSGCCGGGDCAAVPLDADWVQPVAGGFQVTMTTEQVHEVNDRSHTPINEIVPWSRVQPLAAGPPAALYHVCIWGDQLRCLFIASGV